MWIVPVYNYVARYFQPRVLEMNFQQISSVYLLKQLSNQTRVIHNAKAKCGLYKCVPANSSGQSQIYCSCPLSRMQDAIYLECPGKLGHQLPRPFRYWYRSSYVVRQLIFVVVSTRYHNRDIFSDVIMWCDVMLV